MPSATLIQALEPFNLLGEKMGLFSSSSDKELDWETIEQKMNIRTERLRVPNGWIVRTSRGSSGGVTFYPDPEHSWTV